jgi:hypothetical protein
MIYNLTGYLRTTIPSLKFYANGAPTDAPDTCIYVNDMGGSERPWFDRQESRIQIISRARSRDTAKQNADTVYKNIKKKFGISLPAVTVGGVLYPLVKTWAILPIEAPQYLTDDDSGAPLFVFTVTITTTKKG